MRSLRWLLLIAALLSAGPVQAQAPRAADQRPYKIVMVLFRGETEVEQGFREYLENARIPVEIIVRNMDRDRSKLPGFVEEIRRIKPDLVYTWGTPATLGVVGTYDGVDPAKHITDIPVLFTLVADPVGAKLVPDLQSSGRNITGAVHIVPLASQLNAIAAYRPFKKLGVVYNPAEQNSVLNIKGLRELAQQMNFELIEQPVPLDAKGEPRPEVVPDLVTAVSKKGAEFLYIGPDTFIGDQRVPITKKALELRLPTFTATELEIRTSDTMLGLVTRYHNLGRFTAYKAEQILVEKRNPKDIPVETLKRFSYIIRIAVANELKLYPPMSVLKYAEVIE
jgi:putative ABC transport system substrate-binding protein